MASSLLKSTLHNSIAEGLYREISNNTSRYYYFLGKTLSWGNEVTPPEPIDNFEYELQTRNEIITTKEIAPTDISLVIPRIDWKINTVYDMYDDKYGTQVIGVDLIDGGTGYTSVPNVYIGDTGSVVWAANTAYSIGQLVKSGSNYYIVTVSGTSGASAPTHTAATAVNGSVTLQYVTVNNGGGTGATAVASISLGKITDITLTSGGSGYVSAPTVIVAGLYGSGAKVSSVINIAYSGSTTLESAKYYVVTDEFNVYKCLDNNDNAFSIAKPYGTDIDPITTSDGYIWKFMYTIPITFRNKFVTPSLIPVTTALRTQFYTNGSIGKINMTNMGSGYSYATATITGDGSLESDPFYIEEVVVNNGGTGFTSATVTISLPFGDVAAWSANTACIIGQRVQFGINIYEVIVAGTFGSTGPTHKFGVVANGTASLKYVGAQATGTATVSGGKVTAVKLIGRLRRIALTSGGSGYTSAPTVNITGGSPTANAQAFATVIGGAVVSITVFDSGEGFTSVPTITIGTQWTATTALMLGAQVCAGNRLYTVTVAGTTGSSAPTHTSGTATNGTCTLQYSGTCATATATLAYGSGYSTAPTVSFTGGTGYSAYIIGSKSEALVTPIVYNSQVVDIQVNNPGVGYTYANVNIVGDGTGASALADFNIGDISTLQANVELLATDGSIEAIKLISGGYGYVTATVTITGDGTGATATATVTGGRISKITITNPGSGYRYANVTISGGGIGTGATARAIMSPYGGHGKDAVNEFYAKTLMMYSSISRELNQGFTVNNDYRQIGIIKNPRQFGNNYVFTEALGTACWVIASNINTSLFTQDMNIRRGSDNKLFRIVSVTSSDVLVQSLENAAPAINDVFYNDNNQSFTAAAVTSPDFDKYSGDILYIDNRTAFAPTAEETVSLRTVIVF